MEAIIKNGIITGYEIGNSISIHSHIHYPEDWRITIRPLQIFGEYLCKKGCTESEIARYLSVFLTKKIKLTTELLKEVTPFT